LKKNARKNHDPRKKNCDRTDQGGRSGSEKREPEAAPIKENLREHTAFKASEKDERRDRVSVWVKSTTLEYERELHELQIELVKMQSQVKADGLRVVLLFEGRDAAGKGGTIKRFTEHMNPRGARVVALEKPSDKERTLWYFQRYVAHLPAAGEIVFFDRSWYNRAMVEPVMGFCTDEENKRFLKDVPLFEQMLVKDGIILFKFYFSVSKKEQLRRFKSRHGDLLKRYKISPVDEQAQDLWDQYTVKKFQMLSETNRTIAPWTIVRSDIKKLARLNCIKYVLTHIEYRDKVPTERLQVDPEIIVSGIDELKMMEDNLMAPKSLPG
jgi:polyphosphate kinase 2